MTMQTMTTVVDSNNDARVSPVTDQGGARGSDDDGTRWVDDDDDEGTRNSDDDGNANEGDRNDGGGDG